MMVLGWTGSPNSVLNYFGKLPSRGCCFLMALMRKSSGATKAKPSTSIGNLTRTFGRLNIGAQRGGSFALAIGIVRIGDIEEHQGQRVFSVGIVRVTEDVPKPRGPLDQRAGLVIAGALEPPPVPSGSHR